MARSLSIPHSARPVLIRFLGIWIPIILFVGLSGLLFYRHEIKKHFQVTGYGQAVLLQSAQKLVREIIDPVIDDLHFVSGLCTETCSAGSPDSSADSWVPGLEQEIMAFARSHPGYDQIRILDTNGMERFRVNNTGDGPRLVSRADLQDKANRYYFNDTIKLAQGEIYISPLDLNIEQGAIEQPLKPMLRFGQVIFDAEGQKVAAIIFNYKAGLLLSKLRQWARQQQGDLVLVNRDGYYLSGPDEERQWGFMFPERSAHTLAQEMPQLWNDHINREERGQLIIDHDLWTFSTVYPLREYDKSSTGSGTAFGESRPLTDSRQYYWKLVSHVPSSMVDAFFNRLKSQFFLALIGLSLVLGLFSYYLSLALVRRDRAQKDLRSTNEILELKVRERTRELESRNEHLRREIEQRRAVEKTLAQSEHNYAILLEAMYEGVFVADTRGTITFCNSRFATMLAYEPAEITGRGLFTLVDEENETIFRQQLPSAEQAASHPYEINWLTCSGTRLSTSVSLASLHDESGTHQGFVGLITDITEQKRALAEKEKLEKRLYQSQKMEALGTLAGGIAHDFNNILAAILGYAELAHDDTLKGLSTRDCYQEIMIAGNRAKDLVQQILSFSRQSDTQRRVFRPARIVKESLKLLRPSIPSTIEIAEDIDKDAGPINADPTQFNQILLNLCTNAFHAMEHRGGVLTIRLGEKFFDRHDLHYQIGMQPGTYVHLSIQDTGEGIQEEIRDKIFDPYFTTKRVGKGTGLGLAIVHGLVESFGGFISLYSEPGSGTVFNIFIPAVHEGHNGEEEDVGYSPASGNEHILVVDDEESLVRLIDRKMTSMGYTVTVTTDSLKALELFEQNPDIYDVVVTDQTMPGLTGLDLAGKLHALKPALPIILSTGFDSSISAHQIEEAGIRELIIKPISLKDFSRILRRVLKESDKAAAAPPAE